MKLTVFTLCCVILMGYAPQSLSRPVSYPGGWTVMQRNDKNAHSLQVHYSPTARYSIGYRTEYWRGEEWQFHGAQLNYLVKRHNAATSQANFYLKGGLGVAYDDLGVPDGEAQPAAFADIALDWETRRYFTSYENRVYYAEDIAKFFRQKARVGIAPYIGDYGDIHTWLMLQVDHITGERDNILFTPFVRFFKNEYLAEVGISDKGGILFNLIIRF